MKRPTVIHPFLLAIFPILFLLAHNIAQFLPNETFIPLAMATGLTWLAWSGLSMILKDREKAGLLVSLFLLLFFSYGHVYNLLVEYSFAYLLVGDGEIGLDLILLVEWGLLFLVGAYASIKTRRALHDLTSALNVMTAILVVISLVNIGSYKLQTEGTWPDQDNVETVASAATHQADLDSVGPRPDIYYIILDGYARDDVLEGMYGYENTEFLDYLTETGFYVSKHSRSNYAQTALSLASSLNFTYLDNVAAQIGVESENRVPLKQLIANNAAAQFLQGQGYAFVSFSSGYDLTEITTADIYKTPPDSLSEFQNLLFNTTPLPVLANRLTNFQQDLHRKRLLYIFDQLPGVAEIRPPVFVLAHIIAPHPPFVFSSDGEPADTNRVFSFVDGSHFIKDRPDKANYKERYKDQLRFVNSRISEVIDNILANSSQPPIIILQSDHGPGSMLDWNNPANTNYKERMSILNAYYLPTMDHSQLYDDITPVNTFRVVFNHYFGTRYELLQDESYFSGWFHPFEFINVTDDIRSKSDGSVFSPVPQSSDQTQ